MIAARAVDFIQPSVTQDRRHHAHVPHRDRGREGRRHLRAAHVPTSVRGYLATLHCVACKERDVPLERLFADVGWVAYANTVPDRNGAVDVPDRPGLGADPELDMIEKSAKSVTTAAAAIRPIAGAAADANVPQNKIRLGGPNEETAGLGTLALIGATIAERAGSAENLSVAPRHRDRAVCGRRSGRHHRPHRGRHLLAPSRPAIRGRERRRRRRHHRDRARRARQPRRLHHHFRPHGHARRCSGALLRT